MRSMKTVDPTNEKDALLKAQKGYRLAKEGLTELMAIARTADDSEAFLAASELLGETIALHARAGQAAMAIFSDGGVVVMGPGR